MSNVQGKATSILTKNNVMAGSIKMKRQIATVINIFYLSQFQTKSTLNFFA